VNDLPVTRESIGCREVYFHKLNIEWQRDETRQYFGKCDLCHFVAVQHNKWLFDLDFLAHGEPPHEKYRGYIYQRLCGRRVSEKTGKP
jgi:hypothetical protein